MDPITISENSYMDVSSLSSAQAGGEADEDDIVPVSDTLIDSGFFQRLKRVTKNTHLMIGGRAKRMTGGVGKLDPTSVISSPSEKIKVPEGSMGSQNPIKTPKASLTEQLRGLTAGPVEKAKEESTSDSSDSISDVSSESSSEIDREYTKVKQTGGKKKTKVKVDVEFEQNAKGGSLDRSEYSLFTENG